MFVKKALRKCYCVLWKVPKPYAFTLLFSPNSISGFFRQHWRLSDITAEKRIFF